MLYVILLQTVSSYGANVQVGQTDCRNYHKHIEAPYERAVYFLTCQGRKNGNNLAVLINGLQLKNYKFFALKRTSQ
jgi:hypothetical protein